MIITSDDRRVILADYKALRESQYFTPARALRVIRSSYANVIASALADGGQPCAPTVARWAAASGYLESIAARTAYWQRP